MLRRIDVEEMEIKNLAPYAAHSGRSEGRVHPEEEHEFRTRFQRDRDRVIHSRAFRRLEYKTQVFVNHEGDYYRTRLTHSLEVAQIARTIARCLRLNEDLAEAVSLSHDLGHTPFGHSGQDVMNHLMKEFGGFEHNRQSFRVVTLLEQRYPGFYGLNLTYEVLEGITKHSTQYDMPDGSMFTRKGFPTLEAQICNYADEIAYNNHDIDDGLKSGMIALGALAQVEIWEDMFQRTKREFPNLMSQMLISQTMNRLINVLVSDLAVQTEHNIAAKGINSLNDVRERGKGVVGFSDLIRKQGQQLKRFLYDHLYRHYRVVRMADKAERIITWLFQAYQKNLLIIPPDFLRRYLMPEAQYRATFQLKELNEPVERIICDYIAGMTDRFALDEYKKLFDPHERV